MDLFNDLGMKYYFTSFGDVYRGFEYPLLQMPGYKFIVQSDRAIEISKLNVHEIPVDQLKNYGWVVPKDVIQLETGDESIIQTQDFGEPLHISPDYNRKDMFIIGAGASAHCVTDELKDDFCNDNLRPPMGDELFAKKYREFYKKYGGVMQSLIDLQQKDINVEAYLEDDWKEIEAGHNDAMSRHINIQYYLQDLLKNISEHICEKYLEASLFFRLANKLQKLRKSDRTRHFGFISFNQDTILEHFLQLQFKHKIKEMDDYINLNESPFSVFKPHGSWNWGWKFKKPITNPAQTFFEKNINFFQLYYKVLGSPTEMIDLSSFYKEKIVHEHDLGRFTVNKSNIQIIPPTETDDYYPALLLPYRDKDELVLPQRHFIALTSFLTTAENLHIIGWKGNERAFVKLLTLHAKNLKKIVIADPHPEAVELNLSKFLAGKNIEIVHYSGFEDFVDRGI